MCVDKVKLGVVDLSKLKRESEGAQPSPGIYGYRLVQGAFRWLARAEHCHGVPTLCERVSHIVRLIPAADFAVARQIERYHCDVQAEVPDLLANMKCNKLISRVADWLRQHGSLKNTAFVSKRVNQYTREGTLAWTIDLRRNVARVARIVWHRAAGAGRISCDRDQGMNGDIVAKSKTSADSEEKVPESTRPFYDAIVAATDGFCREYLNDEYAGLCRKLTAALARKRPSPLLSGKLHVWTCAIIRVIGWVNFLDDKASSPHMKLTAIDEAFGVAQSTAQAKSKAIREMLRVHQFDWRWMLRDSMADNIGVWMLTVDGWPIDIRDAPIEIQEAAFHKGLIPYVPGDVG